MAVLIAPHCFGLNPEHSISQYAHSSWTQGEGDLRGMVLALAQTPDGALWVGTEFGLFRFDGVSFNKCDLPSFESSTSITSLAADEEGEVWIGTRRGLFRWNHRSSQLTHIRKILDQASVSSPCLKGR